MKIKKIDYIENTPVPGIKKITPKHCNLNLFLCMAIIGGRNKSKTNCCINLIKDLQKQKCVDDIYLVSPTIKNNPFHHLKVKDDHQYDTNKRDINEILNEIEKKAEDRLNIWKDLKERPKKEFNKIYKKLYKAFEDKKDSDITEDGAKLLEYSDFKKRSDFYDKIPSCCVVLDDIVQHLSNSKHDKITDFTLNGRHKNMNVFTLSQCFCNGILLFLRSNMEQYILFKFRDNKVLKTMYDEVFANYFDSFNEFKEFYNQVLGDNKHDFILYDDKPKKEEYRFRKNFNELIDLDCP